ncbi:hypothetical protein N7533_011614 [Penicillium manginii]|uniref:uncharacterized protein n=1 Tax=Penicillium manginii TaxID=203109 RepID=UPI002548184F|nr:uncharacterized protein N7533_011614 [Penicillium manginii]KAJ5742205.1 hypothetical protein N7533_011614 [Penicillium manginii]
MLSQRLLHRYPLHAQLRERPRARPATPLSILLQTRYSSAQAGATIDLRTTVPAPLDLPARQPGQGAASHLYATGKAYLAFYRTGLRHVWLNYRSARGIQRSLRDQGLTVPQAIAKGRLTRAQFQLLHRNRHDIRRVPLFALVCVCCGELTPLVVLLLANQVPWTCRTPSQVRKSRQRQDALRISGQQQQNIAHNGNGREALVRASGVLGLRGRWLRPPKGVLQHRLDRHVNYLECDDRLILSSPDKDGPREWAVTEVESALVDRGISVSGRSEKELRDALDNWLSDRSQADVRGLLQRRVEGCSTA